MHILLLDALRMHALLNSHDLPLTISVHFCAQFVQLFICCRAKWAVTSCGMTSSMNNSRGLLLVSFIIVPASQANACHYFTRSTKAFRQEVRQLAWKTVCAWVQTEDFTMSGQSAKASITNVAARHKRHTRDCHYFYLGLYGFICSQSSSVWYPGLRNGVCEAASR